MPSSVTVSVVNHNHAQHLGACLSAIRNQSLAPREVIITDNASQDGSRQWLQKHASDACLIMCERNLGFATAHNHVFRQSATPYVLALNPDVTLDRDFLRHAVTALETHSTVGSVCGRLYRGRHPDRSVLDSTGLMPDRYRRFHDRDHDRPSHGLRAEQGLVFGTSGSAALFRRSMLEDVAYGSEYFDETFFAYYEDADLAWRAMRLGWDSLYIPDAVGWHVHDDAPTTRSRRRDADAQLRRFLFIRNRHLCFLKNDSFPEAIGESHRIAGYELALQLLLVPREPKLAFEWQASLARCLPEVGRRRMDVFKRQRRSVRLSDWFDSG